MSYRIIIPMLHYYPDRPSGSTRLAFDEAVFLSQLGHEVWVVTQDLSGDKPEYSFQDGLHVLRYPTPRFGLFDPRRMQAHQKRTRDLLLRYVGNHVDVVHGHSLLHYDGALALYGKSARTCYSVHSPVYLEMQAGSRGVSALHRLRLSITARLTRRIEHKCLRRSDCVTVYSNYTKTLLEQLHTAEIQDKTQVIPGWVDLERFRIVSDRQAAKSKLRWPTNVPVFFTLRRLVPRMGLDRLIHAANKVKSAGWKFNLVIGGRGPLLSQLTALANELDLGDCVQFIGFVPAATLPLMYAAADAFVLPTAELECFGLIALESLACGRPVLATPVGAIPEVLNHFEKAWLAQDAGADAIARLLMDYLKGVLPSHNPAMLRKTVAKHYSRQRILEKLTATVLNLSPAEGVGGRGT